MTGSVFLRLVPFAVSLAISLGVAIYCWRHRREVGAAAYALVAASQASWTLGYILELTSPTLNAKILWDDFQYLGLAGWVIGIIAFTLTFTGRPPVRSWLTAALVGLPLLVLAFLAYTDPSHHLIRREPHLVEGRHFSLLLYGFSRLALAGAIYTYGCFVLLSGILAAKRLRVHRLYRVQVDLVLTGNLIPIVGSVVSLTALRNNPMRDLSPLTFAVGNLVVAWGLFRYRLFDVVPVARDAVIEAIDEALFVLDSRDRLVDLNPTAQRLLGPRASGSIGRPAAELVSDWARVVERRGSGESNRRDATPVHEAATVRAEPEVLHFQTQEDNRIMEISSYALRDRHGGVQGRIVLCRDVTARARLEQELHVHRERLEELVEERTSELRAQVTAREQAEAQLRQAQKMEAVGRMAGGIAHDFNNRLQALTLTLEEMVAADPALAKSESLAQLMREIDRSTELIGRLMLFSRRQPVALQVLDLNDAIAGSLSLVHRAIGPTIELVTDLAPNPWPVRADGVQLDQVLVNLAINARDAMPDGGRLTVTTRSVGVSATDPVARASPTGEAVRLEVSDTGRGMDAEIQDHIFDPFFTTKPPGKGTGLGLSTVYGIVQQSNGTIAVRSAPGAGSTFTITFPRATPEPPSAEPIRTAAAIPAPMGRATVLLVEDEDAIRRAAERLLSRAGFDVLVAADGAEALRQFDAAVSAVDLVVTDLAMPGVGGRTLVRELRERRPDIPVLVVSGDADHAASVRALGGPTHFLAKPFLVAELIEAVRRLLVPAPH